MKTSLSIYIWDNKQTGDRYTIAIEYPGDSTIGIWGCNSTPFHATYGVAQFSHSIDKADFTAAKTKHFGKKIKYHALCPDIQKYIRTLITMED